MFHAATHNTAKHMRHNNHITAERITHDMLSGIIKLDVAFTSNLQHKDNISNASTKGSVSRKEIRINDVQSSIFII